MAASCSHWWHAPIYISISIVLAIVAITTTPSDSESPPLETPLNTSISHDLSVNASRALRNYGFNFMATLLQVSPQLFLPPSESTIFAIQDSSISNISLPPWLMKDLLHYHTSPSKLSMNDLLNQSQGSCLPTLLHGKNFQLTKIKTDERLVEINGVLVSHPDIFTQGAYSFHGVVAPFSSFDPLEKHENWDFIRSPSCGNENSGLVPNVTEGRNRVPWNRIVRLLSSNGYVSFAIGLHSVLEGLLKDLVDLNAVTIFAAPDFAYLASPSPFLERIVRFHVVPHRFGYKDLVAMPEKTSIRTLVSDCSLAISADYSIRETVSINGVEIIAPDFFSSEAFVIHGISRPFEMVKLWPNRLG